MSSDLSHELFSISWQSEVIFLGFGVDFVAKGLKALGKAKIDGPKPSQKINLSGANPAAFVIPRWLDFPAAFWKNVERIAKRHHVQESDVLSRGVELFDNANREAKALNNLAAVQTATDKLEDDSAFLLYRKLARRFGGPKNISAEQRSENARKASRARWKK